MSNFMKPEYVKDAIDALKEAGIDFASGVPDGWLRNLLDSIEQDQHFKFVPVSNEGVGFCVCAGAWMAGKKPCIIMENSGLRVMVEDIARVSMHSGIPVLLIMSYRGDIGETESWAIPHGKTMKPLLNALRIPYTIVRKSDDLKKSIVRTASLAFSSLYPAAVAIGGDLI